MLGALHVEHFVFAIAASLKDDGQRRRVIPCFKIGRRILFDSLRQSE